MSNLYDLSTLPKIPNLVITRSGVKTIFDKDTVEIVDFNLKHCFSFDKYNDSYIKYCVKLFLSFVLKTQSLSHAMNFDRELGLVLGGKVRTLDIGRNIKTRITRNIKDRRNTADEYRIWYLKAWYRWCNSMELPFFEDDFCQTLSALRLAGNEKGMSVLSLDNETGPLDQRELSQLLNSLEKFDNDSYIFEKTLTYMYLTLGCNSSNVTLLHWDDFKIFESSGQKIYFLNIPRIKKRHSKNREEFKKRELDSRLGRLIEKYRQKSSCTKIMFTRKAGKYFISSTASVVSSFCSNELGLKFHVTPRRLRYTFATRLVMNGVSKEKLADLLDHSDLQHVQIYYDLRHKIKDFLSEAESKELGKVFKKFQGNISNNLGNGDVKFSYLESEDKPIIGKCNSNSMCELNPPYSCFVCNKFNAFNDSVEVYRKILLHLVDWSSKRKDEYGENDRIHSLMHDVQLAIGDLIQRIENA